MSDSAGEVVFMDLEDVDRILRLMYDGSRPPRVQVLLCGCGQRADLRVSDAQAIGWQLLPHVKCPACRAQDPYTGPARERFLKEVAMDVTSKFMIVPKHKTLNGKTVRRAFHESTDMELMTQLATDYAQQRDEDFLIVQVVAEVSKPKKSEKGRQA